MAALEKVTPGQRLRIPANDWNAIIDGTKWTQQQQSLATGAQSAGKRDTDVVSARNDSGSDVPRFGILGVSGFVFNPVDSDPFNINWQNIVSVTGVTPTDAYLGNFAVCLEPIKAGKVGKVAMGGLVPAKVKMIDEGDQYCDVLNGSRAMLRSGAGTARIRAKQPAGGRAVADEAWCYVQVGLPPLWQPRLKITGSTVVVTNIWKYTGIEQIPSFAGGRLTWIDKPNAPTWTNLIFNDAETNNPPTAGVMPSVGFNTSDTTPPATYTVLPLQVGWNGPFETRVVNGTTYYIVNWPNAVDPSCT